MEACYIIQVVTGKETLFVQHAERLLSSALGSEARRHRFIIPRRELTIRRQGKFRKVTSPVFPSYIFWELVDAEANGGEPEGGGWDEAEPEGSELNDATQGELDDGEPKGAKQFKQEAANKEAAKPKGAGWDDLSQKRFNEVRNILRRINGYVRFLKDHEGNLAPLNEHDVRLIHHLITGGEISKASKVSFDVNNRIVALDGPLAGYEGSIIKVNRRKKRAKVQFLLNGKKFLIDFEYEEMQHTEAVEKRDIKKPVSDEAAAERERRSDAGEVPGR